jgi:hypothetical protein
VLIMGTVLAAVAAFGPVWAVRGGVVIAVIAAVIACAAAWGELADARRAHASEMLEATKEHGRTLTEERRHNASVVDSLTVRAKKAAAEIERHRGIIVELDHTVTTLRETNGSLRSTNGSLRGENSNLHAEINRAHDEIRRRETVIESLREIVRAREAELVSVSESGAQVRAIHRRVLDEQQSAWDEVPDADELWTDGSHPTVVGLTEVAVVLPNYEGERRFA